tara:strand:+ start:299 stop:967 length:669 start_codon:yes stop_codon:yes gene_type:complete
MKQHSQAKMKLAQTIVAELKAKMIVGLGAGSTVLCVVEALKNCAHAEMQVVVASLETLEACKHHGIEAELMKSVAYIDLYIDGADEVDPGFLCIKGRGGAMTGEKICAEMAKSFVVLIDESKKVGYLGQKWPVVPLEVVPWARSSVGRSIVKMGAVPELREKKSDLGNDIIDCHGFNLSEPFALASALSQLTGVVSHGLFLEPRPNRVLCSDGQNVYDLSKV